MAMTMPELTVVSDAEEFASPQLGRKVLETRALTKSYQQGKVVLDGISFDLHAGEFVAVVGRSGAGKSTLLHTLNGTIPATSGEILNVHKDLSTDNVLSMSRKEIREWRTHCGMIFQDFCLVPRLDVISNVLLGRLSHTSTLKSLLKIFSDQDKAQAIQLLKWLKHVAVRTTTSRKPLRGTTTTCGNLPCDDAKP